jgi:hypothetical protein
MPLPNNPTILHHHGPKRPSGFFYHSTYPTQFDRPPHEPDMGWKRHLFLSLDPQFSHEGKLSLRFVAVNRSSPFA